MNKKDINDIVVGLIEKASSNDLNDILSELNIRLEKIDASRPLLKGGHACYVQSLKRETIYISRDCPDEIRNFVIAHEIGHAVLHDVELSHYGISKKGQKEEQEADYFAARLLNLKIEPIDGYSAEEYSKILGVKEEAIKYLF